MSTEFLKDFDTLLDEILTDYKNLDPSPNTGVGSVVYTKAAALASMLWGLYRYQDFIARAQFPDTADTDSLNHWGAVYGVSRITGENDNAYAQRMLSYIQQPPAGGTALDYQRWAIATPKTTANIVESFAPAAVDTFYSRITVQQLWVTDKTSPDGVPSTCTFTSTGTLPSPLSPATTYYVQTVDSTHIQLSASNGGTPIALTTQGSGVHTITPTYGANPTYYTIADANILTPPAVQVGTVAIVLDPNDRSILEPADQFYPATITLTNAATTYINSQSPIAAINRISMVTPVVTDVTMTVTPILVDVVKIASDITNYIDALLPGQNLYGAQLVAIAIQDGANTATSIPDVTINQYQLIVPGTITITPSA